MRNPIVRVELMNAPARFAAACPFRAVIDAAAIALVRVATQSVELSSDFAAGATGTIASGGVKAVAATLNSPWTA
jgi:hypothetical protein